MTRHFVAVAFLLALGCRGASEQPETRQAQAPETHAESAQVENILEIEQEMLRDLRITTTRVEQRAGGEGVTVVGELHADQNRYAEVGVPVTARVVSLLAAPGQRIQAGQALAEVQSVELGRARADYHAASARLTLAQSNLERKRSLGVDRIVPRRELQEAEADLSAAQADLHAAAAMLQALGVSPSSGGESSRFALRSPITGTVIERGIARGQMIDPEHVAFRVGDLSTVWLIAHAYERDALRVVPGSLARVTLAAFPGQPFSGRVTYIGGHVEAASRTIPIRVELANPDHLLRPGMSARAWLQVSAGGDVVAVPVSALQRLRDQWVVFVPQSPRTFEIRTVGRGRDLGGEVEIVTGLKAGETVVVDGSFLLKSEAEKAEGGGEHHDH